MVVWLSDRQCEHDGGGRGDNKRKPDCGREQYYECEYEFDFFTFQVNESHDLIFNHAEHLDDEHRFLDIEYEFNVELGNSHRNKWRRRAAVTIRIRRRESVRHHTSTVGLSIPEFPVKRWHVHHDRGDDSSAHDDAVVMHLAGEVCIWKLPVNRDQRRERRGSDGERT